METTSVGVLAKCEGSVEVQFYTTLISNCIDVTSMKGHLPKSIPDRVLKGMILQTILRAEDEHLELTSEDIHFYVSNNEFHFESPETDQYGRPEWSGDYSYDSLPGIRSTLTYLRQNGYISKQGTERPFTFHLTTEGRLHADDPFYKYNLKMAYMQKRVDKIVQRTLDNDEHVNELAERKRIELCKTCRLSNPKAKRLQARANTVRPNKGRIGIQRKDGTVKDVEVTEEGEIKELEDLKASLVMKDGKVDVQSTILSQQNEIEGMKNVLAEQGIRYNKTVTQLDKMKNRKGKLDAQRLHRGMTRMEIAHWYLNNNMYLDAEFFEIWKGSLVVVEYKRTLDMDILNVSYDIQSKKGEILTRTGFSRRILEPEEIPSIGIYVAEIKGGSIIVDSEHFQAPKSLVV